MIWVALMAAVDPRVRPLQGALWQWGRNKVAFSSGPQQSPKKLIILGGLTDGLLPCRWVPALSHAAADEGWSTIQPTLSSSYAGYGTGMLQRDADELSELVEHMAAERGCEQVAIVGHSTGCQIAVHFAAHGSPVALGRLAAIVLQAPVSDQESGSLSAETAKWLAHARALSTPATTLMPLEAHYVPITAERFLSLYDETGGKQPDDLFSSYLSEAQLQSKLKHLDRLPTLVAFSMADEYVPPSVDKRELVARLSHAMGEGTVQLCLEGGNHSLDEPADGSAAKRFVEATVELLRGAAAKGSK
jgi:pimeloyl-ACP methyl ester carboxylesterase